MLADPQITAETVRAAQKLIGLDFTFSEKGSMLEDLSKCVEQYQQSRRVELQNNVTPVLGFDPRLPGAGNGVNTGQPIYDTPLHLRLRPVDQAIVFPILSHRVQGKELVISQCLEFVGCRSSHALLPSLAVVSFDAILAIAVAIDQGSDQLLVAPILVDTAQTILHG